MNTKCILIVEDEPKARKTLSDILRAKGYSPTTAATGKTALDMARKKTPQAALIDIRLGDISGLEVMKEIKKYSPMTECIVLTGHASQESAVDAVNLGAYFYVRKPYDMEHLLVIIRRAVEKQEAEEALRKSEEKYKFLYEESDTISLIIGIDGKIIDANRKIQKILGYSKDEAIGKDALEIVVPEHREKITAILDNNFKGEDTTEIDVGLYDKNGAIHTIVFSSRQVVLYEENKPSSILITGIDVTNRKQVEEALRESEEKYRTIFELSADAIMLARADGEILDVNLAMPLIIGYSKEEIKELGGGAIIAPEVLEDTIKYWTSQVEEKGWFHVETLWVGKDGSRIPVSVLGKTMDISGENMFVVIGRDITERKQAEEALQESEERFRSFLDSATEACMLTDSKLNYVAINRVGLNYFPSVTGSEDVIGRNILDVSPGLEKTGRYDKYLQVIKTGEPFSIDDVVPHPKFGDVHLNIRAFKVGDGLGLIAENITERKKIEKEIEMLAKFPSENPNPVIRVAKNGIVLYGNEASKPLLYHWGIEVSQSLPVHWKKLIEESLDTGQNRIEEEEEADDKIFSFMLAPVTEAEYVNVYGRDITKRKRAEKEIEKLAKFPSENPNPVLRISKDGNILYSNKTSHELLTVWRYKEGQPLSDQWLQPVKEALDSEKYKQTEVECGDKILSLTFAPVVDFNYVNVYGLDITERKQAEEALQEAHDELEKRVKERTAELMAAQEQIIRSERLAATGQLAASVAHEINSPLQAITMLLGTMRKENEENKELLNNIDLLKGSFYNIRDTVKNLMDLNRTGKERKQMINVNAITKSTVALMKSHLKKNKVKIDLNLSPAIPDMIASPQQLGHVFLNLINNAVEAMSGISKSEAKWKERAKIGGAISIKTMLKNDKVVIQVSDTGPGIAEMDLEHIFDPFYTRKKTMGTGVGLSICNGIIEDHNGTIKAKNAKDGGAVFTVTLPVKKG